MIKPAAQRQVWDRVCYARTAYDNLVDVLGRRHPRQGVALDACLQAQECATKTAEQHHDLPRDPTPLRIISLATKSKLRSLVIVEGCGLEHRRTPTSRTVGRGCVRSTPR